MEKKKNRRIKKNKFSKFLILTLVIITILFIGLIFYIDLLPTKYLVIITGVIITLDLFNISILRIKKLKKKLRKVFSFFTIFWIIVMLAISFYLCKTLGVLLSNGDSKYKLEHYSVIVLKSSKFNKTVDLKNKKVGYYKKTIGALDANEKLKKEVSVKFKSYMEPKKMLEDLDNRNISSILIEDSIKSIMEEENSDFSKKYKVIYTFKIKVKSETTIKDVDVSKKPFAIYLSGIDTYGEISSVSRSDVNIVAVVNPKTNQVLLISIPRDYYVQLHGTTGTKDKLTHAGIYGIDMSVKTLEDLLDLDINYYFKVNFTSVIDIVDVLGGLDVYSDYTFISYSGYSFKAGYNSVNGEEALDFVRTRKAFVEGDRQRGKNQQALINAIIQKVTSKNIITKYSLLLDAVNGKYQTNMPSKKIISLVKKQLNDMSKWNVTSYSLEGENSSNYTYTYNQLLYVMEPVEDSVNAAKELIQQVINGEKLEGSYVENAGNSNSVYKTKSTPQNNDTNNANNNENKTTESPKNEELEKEKKQQDIQKTQEEKIEENKEENSNQTQKNSDDSKEDEPNETIDDIVPAN